MLSGTNLTKFKSTCAVQVGVLDLIAQMAVVEHFKSI